MKKSSMKSLVAFLSTMPIPADVAEIKAELEAELQKGEDKAAANRVLYATAHDVVFAKLSDKPMTIAEIWEVVKDEMPEGFTKSKLQYAIREYWGDEVIKTEGKVNEYQKRA